MSPLLFKLIYHLEREFSLKSILLFCPWPGNLWEEKSSRLISWEKHFFGWT